eukprot:PhF_6_TR25285/c0_g1_i2/m.34867
MDGTVEVVVAGSALNEYYNNVEVDEEDKDNVIVQSVQLEFASTETDTHNPTVLQQTQSTQPTLFMNSRVLSPCMSWFYFVVLRSVFASHRLVSVLSLCICVVSHVRLFSSNLRQRGIEVFQNFTTQQQNCRRLRFEVSLVGNCPTLGDSIAQQLQDITARVHSVWSLYHTDWTNTHVCVQTMPLLGLVRCVAVTERGTNQLHELYSKYSNVMLSSSTSSSAEQQQQITNTSPSGGDGIRHVLQSIESLLELRSTLSMDTEREEFDALDIAIQQRIHALGSIWRGYLESKHHVRESTENTENDGGDLVEVRGGVIGSDDNTNTNIEYNETSRFCYPPADDDDTTSSSSSSGTEGEAGGVTSAQHQHLLTPGRQVFGLPRIDATTGQAVLQTKTTTSAPPLHEKGTHHGNLQTSL